MICRLFGIVSLLLLQSAAMAESLYRESIFRGLIADQKAYQPGDLLTVQVFENSSASTTADTGTRRRNALRAEATHGSNGRGAHAAVDVGSEFDGGGTTQRANRVLITLSVTVREVLPNGELRVSGDQLLVVNNEQQRVTVEGRVRPQDVSESNTVLSTRLADARITYLGEGEVSERQQRAWWRRLLDKAGL